MLHRNRPCAAGTESRRVTEPSWTWLGLLVGILISMAVAAPAYADTASISFTDAAGNSDPVAGVGRTLTLAGNTAAPENVYAAYRAAGGAPCAPSADSDAGSGSFPGFPGPGGVGESTFNGTSVNGDFSLVKTGIWPTAGTFLFCIWLAPSADAAVTPISQTITFRQPGGTISATVNPVAPSPGQTATITVTGSSEAPENVYATIRAAGSGASCGPTYSADSGNSLIDGTSVDGAFSISNTVTESNAGTYLICLWLASSEESTAIAGPQPETFTVPAPPPPACVAPNLSGLVLATAQQRLRNGHCTAGVVSHIYSTSVASGRVISTSPGPGSYANGTSVALIVSSGPPPCVTPSLHGLSLSKAKAMLRQANCSLGKVLRPLHIRRGHVLHVRRQTPAAGSRHRYGYPVGLTVT
jgi:hypothetical protein